MKITDVRTGVVEANYVGRAFIRGYTDVTGLGERFLTLPQGGICHGR